MVKRKKERPVGVTILAILGYISAVFTLIFGLIALIAAPVFFALIPQIADLPLLAAIGSALTIIGGIFFIACAVLEYFIAKGLWDDKNWTRVLLLIFVWICAIGSLFSLQIVGLIIDGIIIWYMQFVPKVKSYFK